MIALATLNIHCEQTIDSQDLSNLDVPIERISSKPQTIINRVVKEPKVITERVVGKTRYITDTFVEPTRQQIIVQPYRNTVTEELNPVFVKQEDKFVERDAVTEPTRQKHRRVARTINVEGNQVHRRTFIEPRVNNYREEVTFQPSADIRRTLPAQYQPVKQSSHNQVREATVQGDITINRHFVEPHYIKEDVKVNWVDQTQQNHEREPVTEETKIETRNRTQNVSQQGDLYITQPVVIPSAHHEGVRINYQRQPTIQKTLDTIKKADIKTGHSQVVNYNKVYNVAVPKPVGVPTPTVYTVPYVKYEYVPVEEPCDPCCCGQKGGVAKIVNHTSVNWVSGKGGKKMRSVSNRDPNDSSEENADKPKSWGDVVERFNQLNGEKGALYAKGMLSGNEEAEARRNLEKLTKAYKKKHVSYSSSESESVEDSSYDLQGRLSPHPIKSVSHWNVKKNYGKVYVKPHRQTRAKRFNPFHDGYKSDNQPVFLNTNMKAHGPIPYERY